MRLFVYAICFVWAAAPLLAEELYIQTFGEMGDTPVVFLHGGPGYNCSTFEVTTGQALADEGFFVIVYDRRGEGRSTKTADYTYEQSNKDLLYILDKYDLMDVGLLAHSFGGIIAVNFAEAHPERVNSVVMIGAPLNMQPTFRNIISRSEKIYSDAGDNANLGYINMLKNMDTTSIQYSSFSFMHAMQNGFYTPDSITPSARKLYRLMATDETLKTYASSMDAVAPQGFWAKEGYTYTDYTDLYAAAAKEGVEFYGLYGKEDGLFSEEQFSGLRGLFGEANVRVLENCSHSVYIDQQEKFIASLKKWLK